MPESYSTRGRLHIVVIAFMFAPLVGGAEVQAEKHARQLQALGHDVTIVTFRHNKQWPRKETLQGLPIIRVGGIYRHNGWMHIGQLGHIAFNLAMLLTLWRLRHRYDVIHAMQLSSTSAIATLVCQLTHTPIVISVQSAGPDEKQQTHHEQRGVSLMADTLNASEFLKVAAQDWVAGDIEDLCHSTPGGYAFLHFLRRSQAYYQVLSTRCYSYLTTHGFKPAHIERIPNGIDTTKFQPIDLHPDLANTERVIICVARLEYPKGVDVLLHAWGRMMDAPAAWRAHLRPRLCLVGRGIFQPQMEFIVTELGIQDSVEFLGLRTDIVDLLQQAWAFVMPSRWEGMPNALLEAMACGLPCVATRVSGSEDVIIDGVNGLLVEPEEPAALALALHRIIEDSMLAQKLAQNAHATILQNYQITAVAEQCLHLYYRLRSQGQPTWPLKLGETRKV